MIQEAREQSGKADRCERTWERELQHRIPASLAQQITVFETQLELKRQGKTADALFAETRLRRGVYGQRYDNGQRHDGVSSQRLEFPCGELTKGPGTCWDAPGMMRIKIPFGAVTAEQLDAMGELVEEYGDGIAHVTTRQDFQIHFVHIDDTPDLMRRLAAVGITTEEACGNVVRNVTACPFAGVCGGAAFDVTPYARALSSFLMGHEDTQNFGRKLKVAFSGCDSEGCGLARMHDIGAVARLRPGAQQGAEPERGFAFYVGGGLGAVPQQARLLYDFVSADELLPLSQAVCRVFARLGEKKNRARARLKFLVAKLGVDALRRLVDEERQSLPYDPAWTAYLSDLTLGTDGPAKPPSEFRDYPLTAANSDASGRSAAYGEWFTTNVRPQAQAGYGAVTLNLPLGDISASQARGLADLMRRFTGDTARLTVEQNILLRWVSLADLPQLYDGLCALGLAAPGAGTLIDVAACPGTDTCKLGIASSRGLARELAERIAARNASLDQAVKGLRIKISGCFNACGQHHIADIGFLGVSRKAGGHTVPHFQLVLGGQWKENAGAFGLAIGAVPSKRVPEVVDRIVSRYAAGREPGDPFQVWVKKSGRATVRGWLQDLLVIPSYESDPSLYSDWGDPREYGISDLGVGECAGEVISATDFGLQAAERQLYEAQEELERGETDGAFERAYRAMLQAARTLAKTRLRDLEAEADAVVAGFRAELYDTQLFFDPFAGGRFAHYLFKAHEESAAVQGVDEERAAQRIQEAQLFIDACHSCNARLSP